MVAAAGLTVSMSCHQWPLLSQTVLPFTGAACAFPATPEELPSFRESGQAPHSLHRVRRSFRHGLIDWRYRSTPRRMGSGRSRTFTGQCCQPFCPGDPTKHPDGPSVVTKCRLAGKRSIPKASAEATGHGPPSRPKRDASQTVFTWPLRHRLLPPGAGCVPSFEVRVKISERAWTRSGRI